MKEKILDILVCPICKGKPIFRERKLVLCPDCKRSFVVKDGIISFINYNDSFYEGKFTESYDLDKKFNFSLLKPFKYIYNLISVDKSRERFFRKNLNRRNQMILDIGCGGGWKDLTEFGKVIGVDVSIKSLKNASKFYDLVIQADILKLPFSDNTFDVVFSSDVIGHIPFDDKQILISEIYRVTKKGGKSIHSVECDSNSLFYKWAKKYPDLFQKYFIEMYGHFGLELPTKVFERFRKVGFIPLIKKADPCKGYIRPIESYLVFFNNEYKNKSIFVKYFISSLNTLLKIKSLKYIINFLLGFFIPLSDLVIPVNHRDSVKICLIK